MPAIAFANCKDDAVHSLVDSPDASAAGPVVVTVDGLPALFDALHRRDYTVVGPTVRDAAIVVAELAAADELPFGWGVETEAGRYRLRRRSDQAAFGHSAGPQSWKSVLHPARVRMWSADRATGTVVAGETGEKLRYALLGVRPCDVQAVSILDRVLAGGRHVEPAYERRRDGSFIIAVEALRLIDRYEPPSPSFVDVPAVEGVGCGATEAPRGLLLHRYDISADGLITSARIVPPTSQNQASIEDDLRRFVAQRLDLDDHELTEQCERVIRNHDPCISCATHFLDLTVERA